MGIRSKRIAAIAPIVLLVTLVTMLVACTPSAQAPAQADRSATKSTDASSPATKSSPKPGGKLTFAARVDIDTLDPQRTGLAPTRKLLGQMFDTLTVLKYGESKVNPGLAEAWKVSEDGKTFTLTLKKGVKFHDGTPFNAEAVKFTLDRITEPAQAKGVSKGVLGPYKSSEVVDDSTINVIFDQPYAPFPTMLSLEVLAPISPAAVQKHGDEFARNPIGTGPFMFKEWVSKDHITLIKNPDYNWAPAIFDHQGPAYLDEVVWQIVPESNTRLSILETGEVQIAEDVPYQDVQRIKQNADLQVASAVPAGTPWTVFPNVARFPTDQLSVRRAMLFATDRETIEKTIFKGESKAAWSMLQPNMLGYASAFAEYKYDPAKAKSILEDDGWKAGTDGIRSKDGKRLEITWITFTGDGYAEMAPLVQAQFRDVGIGLKIEEQSQANAWDAYGKGLHHMGTTQWWFPDPLILRNVIHSKSFQLMNRAQYSNPTVDKLIEDAVAVTDPGKRAEMYGQLQEQLAKDAAAISLVDQVTLVGLRKKVSGYKFSMVTFPLLYDVSL